MNIYNLEIHKQCGLYSLPEDGSIKIMDRKEETEVLFLEEKLTYSKLLFVLEGKVKLKINKLEVQVVGPGNVALVPCNSYLIASVEPGSYLLMVNFTEKEPFCSRYSLVNLMHDADSVEDSSLLTCSMQRMEDIAGVSWLRTTRFQKRKRKSS